VNTRPSQKDTSGSRGQKANAMFLRSLLALGQTFWHRDVMAVVYMFFDCMGEL
jgi:hypothetical protein